MGVAGRGTPQARVSLCDVVSGVWGASVPGYLLLNTEREREVQLVCVCVCLCAQECTVHRYWGDWTIHYPAVSDFTTSSLSKFRAGKKKPHRLVCIRHCRSHRENLRTKKMAWRKEKRVPCSKFSKRPPK